MAVQLLRTALEEPNTDMLQKLLHKYYICYKDFINTITTEYALTCSWNFYKDGNAWLCKIIQKKKTVCWLSVWDTGAKISFYFTEKHKDTVLSLNISEALKQQFISAKNIGKLLPLTIDLNNTSAVNDALLVTTFKMQLK